MIVPMDQSCAFAMRSLWASTMMISSRSYKSSAPSESPNSASVAIRLLTTAPIARGTFR